MDTRKRLFQTGQEIVGVKHDGCGREVGGHGAVVGVGQNAAWQLELS
jgi:hypothetical protein